MDTKIPTEPGIYLFYGMHGRASSMSHQLGRPEKIEIYSATDVRDVRNIDMIRDVAKAPKLTESEARAAFQRVYAALEPEVLCMDGEASRTHVARRRAELNRALHALTIAFGRKVDASEAWAAHAS